eukprot:TRINITY_DN1390_c0_g1_i3.p1 TRINITY_DN1390_c0_g1~~TRINITY_DN1390_c0_g1_i3.p1  ORF type:complete len:180 (-),score=33.34 TRINITY_DN1390_c0_g1_i3:140-679(-)
MLLEPKLAINKMIGPARNYIIWKDKRRKRRQKYERVLEIELKRKTSRRAGKKAAEAGREVSELSMSETPEEKQARTKIAALLRKDAQPDPEAYMYLRLLLQAQRVLDTGCVQIQIQQGDDEWEYLLGVRSGKISDMEASARMDNLINVLQERVKQTNRSEKVMTGALNDYLVHVRRQFL